MWSYLCVVIIGSLIFGTSDTMGANSSLNLLGTENLLPGSDDLERNSVINQMCDMTTDQLIQFNGYKNDSYQVITEDGYILTVFRCYSDEFPMEDLMPILLQHGMMDTSDTFCMNPGIQSLAYFFASKKYIVYMPNSRGNRYSRAHKTLNPNRSPSKFWDFSWYEMGIYDLPAVIDSIIQQRGVEKIPYIGHSQGGTISLVLLSMRPDYNQKLSLVSLMAPFTYMDRVGFPLNIILEFFYLMLPFKNCEFVPNSKPQHVLAEVFCRINGGYFCEKAINFVLGPSVDQRNETMLPVYMSHLPAGISVNQLIHFGQEVQFKYFGQMMQQLIGSPPADFPLGNIWSPISIHYSPTDPHTNPIVIEKLKSKLKNVVDTQEINNVTFDHVDFVWGIHAHEIVYSRIYELILKYSA